MSVRSEKTIVSPSATIASTIDAAQPEGQALAEGNSYAVAQPDNPLTRNIVVSIHTSLNDLCLQKQKGTWSPSHEALKAIFQQKKFVSLDGTSESMGDLKSVVLHDMNVLHVKSSFPMSLGTRITGVDDKTYSSTGEAFSTIVLPHAECTQTKRLQSDDVSLAYEFSKKFPGYTSENLSEKGIHEVTQRRFVLVSADHPIISAISENADKLQMNEISMMPDVNGAFARRGLVKISQSLYESILPHVKSQVASQIKVRDFSRTQVSIQPAEFASWADARSELMVEAKRPLKAQLQAELAAAPDEQSAENIRLEFNAREKALEHDLDHKPMDMHMEISVAYNFLSK